MPVEADERGETYVRTLLLCSQRQSQSFAVQLESCAFSVARHASRMLRERADRLACLAGFSEEERLDLLLSSAGSTARVSSCEADGEKSCNCGRETHFEFKRGVDDVTGERNEGAIIQDESRVNECESRTT